MGVGTSGVVATGLANAPKRAPLTLHLQLAPSMVHKFNRDWLSYCREQESSPLAATRSTFANMQTGLNE